MSAASAPPAAPRPCPICRKPADPRYRPFCSKRCADIDLGRWFGERYRIPAAVPDEDEDDGPETADGDDDPSLT
jgi:uncharacterized protein